MRVLYVTGYYKPAFVYGGPVRSMAALCEGLARAGAGVTVFTTDANGAGRLDVPLERPVDVEGVQVRYYPLAGNGWGYFYAPSLGRALRQRVREFDLVVVESLWGYALMPAASACRRHGVPYVLPTRGQLFPWALGQKQLKKEIYLRAVGRRQINGAAAIHCTAPAEAEAVARLGFRPPAFVVPNAVDTARFAHLPPRGELRGRLGIPGQAMVLLFLGRLTPIKRPDIAVSALAAAISEGLDAHLVLAGPDEGRLGPGLQAQAAALGCAGRLHLTGLLDRDAVLPALAEADLLLMPSEVQENFGMAALEAMAAGVPVLVSQGIPAGQWAEEAGAGRVVPCSGEAFGQATVVLLGTPGQLPEMGARGQTLARRRFDAAVVEQQMLAQYRAIVDTGRPLASRERA